MAKGRHDWYDWTMLGLRWLINAILIANIIYLRFLW